MIVRPKLTPPYGPVKAEIPIILGEWFGMNANEYELGFLYTPAPAENVTTVTPTINGFPGPLYNCSNGLSLKPTSIDFRTVDWTHVTVFLSRLYCEFYVRYGGTATAS